MSLKYLGGGSIVGIPARDLSDEEVKRFGRERLLESGLYGVIPASQRAPSKSDTAPARENKLQAPTLDDKED